ncbi:hypothetical protein OPV22_030621 [Ensete ventricosum]|uniref:Germin-like protein n=1 Tax=Ensete ventricosum TaxID=4639 RepID=A0AAV8QGM2_ENSVE|nr:hypothetical protein OPV22_030621 [Ensete ventricosum]
MAMPSLLTFFSLLVASALAADPDMLQDICVADLDSAVEVNGFACKPAAEVTEADFFFQGLAKPGATNTTMGSLVTAANVEKIPGLNTLGGDVFVFPRGLVHFQKNNGDVPAAALAAFNSQLPGTQSIAATLFAATPPVPDIVLSKAFQIGTREVKKIKGRLAPKK